MILQREDHAVVAGPARSLDQAGAASIPRLFRRRPELRLAPDLARLQIRRVFRLHRDARPRGKYPQDRRAEIRRHAYHFANVDQLTLAMLRDWTAEVVVRRDGIDFDARVAGALAQFAGSRARHVGRIPVRSLAVDLDPVVAEPLRAFDHLFDRQRRPVVPQPEIRDAVKPDLHDAP